MEMCQIPTNEGAGELKEQCIHMMRNEVVHITQTYIKESIGQFAKSKQKPPPHQRAKSQISHLKEEEGTK